MRGICINRFKWTTSMAPMNIEYLPVGSHIRAANKCVGCADRSDIWSVSLMASENAKIREREKERKILIRFIFYNNNDTLIIAIN